MSATTDDPKTVIWARTSETEHPVTWTAEFDGQFGLAYVHVEQKQGEYTDRVWFRLADLEAIVRAARAAKRAGGVS